MGGRPTQCAAHRNRPLNAQQGYQASAAAWPGDASTTEETRSQPAALHTVPPVLVHSAARCYRNSRAVTELHEFPNRGHSLVIDSGWNEVAQTCLGWLKSQGL